MANASGLCSCTALWSRSLFRASGSHLRQQTFNWSSSGSILLLGQHSTGPKVGKLSSWNLVNKLKQLLEKVMFFFKVSLLNHHALQGFCYCCCNNSLANSYPSRILQAILFHWSQTDLGYRLRQCQVAQACVHCIMVGWVFFPFTPKLIIHILLTIWEQMYEWCSENWQFNQLSSEQAIKCQVLHTVWYISGEKLKEKIMADNSLEWKG